MLQETSPRISDTTEFSAYSEKIKQGKSNIARNSHTILARLGQFTFSLYSHKRESDKANKHQAWSMQKHVVLTTLAILTDVGVDSASAILAFLGDYKEAALLKLGYNIGVGIVPQAITDLKNRIKN